MKSIMGLLSKMIPTSTTVLERTGTKVQRFTSFNTSFPLYTGYDAPVINAKNAKLVTLGQKNYARLKDNSFFVKPDQYLLVEEKSGGQGIYIFRDGKLIVHNKFENGHTSEMAGYQIRDYYGNKTDEFDRLKQHMKDAQMSDAQCWR